MNIRTFGMRAFTSARRTRSSANWASPTVRSSNATETQYGIENLPCSPVSGLIVDELVGRHVVDAALDGHDRGRLDGVLLRQRERRVERLVGAGARREPLDADSRVDEIVRRAEPGGRQIPGRAIARDVAWPRSRRRARGLGDCP